MSLWRAIGAGLMGVVVMALPLLLPLWFIDGADRRWPSGWAYAAVYSLLSVGSSVLMAIYRPESLKVRMQGVVGKREKQPLLDAIGLPVFLLYVEAWLVFIPVDVFALHLLPRPAEWLSLLGAAAAVAGMTMGLTAVAQNRFAAPTVQDQRAAGQEVVDTGLYGVVRHPLYSANLLVFSGMALWLGSTAALIGVLVIFAFTVARITIEERQLRETLSGYADYAHRVRSRVIPGVF